MTCFLDLCVSSHLRPFSGTGAGVESPFSSPNFFNNNVTGGASEKGTKAPSLLILHFRSSGTRERYKRDLRHTVPFLDFVVDCVHSCSVSALFPIRSHSQELMYVSKWNITYDHTL